MLLNKVGRQFVISRNLATKPSVKICHLVNRSVIRVQGTESAEFLQGLMTNDIQHLTHNGVNDSAIFAMFLNTQGRVMFDTFISKNKIDDQEYLIDCDREMSGKLVKHLKMYRVRRKLTIDVEENDHIMAVFHPENVIDEIPDDFKCKISYNDTRVKDMGFRVISSDCSANTDLK